MIVLSFDSEQFNTIIKNAVRTVYNENLSFQPKTGTETSKEILNVDEASEFLNIAKQTVYTLTSKREIPHFKRGKKLYFKLSELQNWIDVTKRKTVSELKADTENFLKESSKKFIKKTP